MHASTLMLLCGNVQKHDAAEAHNCALVTSTVSVCGNFGFKHLLLIYFICRMKPMRLQPVKNFERMAG
jgi:hypothetical protein